MSRKYLTIHYIRIIINLKIFYKENDDLYVLGYGIHKLCALVKIVGKILDKMPVSSYLSLITALKSLQPG